MSLVIELESSLNTAHAYERQAEVATRLCRFDEAVQYYNKAIMHMKKARNELKEDGFELELIDLQLSMLEEKYSRAARFQKDLQLYTVDETEDNSHSRIISTSRPSSESEDKPQLIKFPKDDLQKIEELNTCLKECHVHINNLSLELEKTRRELSEERAHRQAAEAELLMFRAGTASHCLQKDTISSMEEKTNESQCPAIMSNIFPLNVQDHALPMDASWFDYFDHKPP